MQHSWTKKQKAEVFRLAKNGTPYNQIADIFGVSPGAIAAQVSLARQEKDRRKQSRLRKKVNELRKKGLAIDISTVVVDKVVEGKWKNKHRTLALRLWKKGAKYDEIANLLGVTRGSVAGQISILRNGDSKKKKAKKKALDIQPKTKVDETVVENIGRRRGRPKRVQIVELVERKKAGRPKNTALKLEFDEIENIRPKFESLMSDNGLSMKDLPRSTRTRVRRNLKLLAKIVSRTEDTKKRYGKVTKRLVDTFRNEDDRICELVGALSPKTTNSVTIQESKSLNSGGYMGEICNLHDKIGELNLKILTLESRQDKYAEGVTVTMSQMQSQLAHLVQQLTVLVSNTQTLTSLIYKGKGTYEVVPTDSKTHGV